MGTRAVITFKDDHDSFSVYQHWDGDPKTVAENIDLAKSRAWKLPRFEAAEFAAAYVAVIKSSEGNIYFSKGASAHRYLSYSYVVTCESGTLRIKVKEH